VLYVLRLKRKDSYLLKSSPELSTWRHTQLLGEVSGHAEKE
jgi:hypothetical protein